MAAKNNKLDEVSTVTNTFLASIEAKKVIRIAGILKAIEDKETSSGTAKRFKGDFAVETEGTTYRARYLFLPEQMKSQLISAAGKIGKWSSLEFVLVATRTEIPATEKTVAVKGWDVTFEINPRIEKPRVLSLLEA